MSTTDSARQKPQAPVIEIIERGASVHDPESPGTGIVRPNEVRFNGIPLLMPRDETIEVHRLALGADDLVQVTLTVFARRVYIGPEV